MPLFAYALLLLTAVVEGGQEPGLLFVSITSGAHHASLRESIRSTWISICKQNPACDYRFFIDAYEQGNEGLKREQETFQDIVFRSACPYMKERHPDHVNYGNAHVFSPEEVAEGGIALADYPLRRMYKIDWKMCFLKWIKEHRKAGEPYPMFHVFVEDDSFACLGNLLHQFELLRKQATAVPPFRTGFALYDGFDDSSTLMTGDVAEFLADHYLVDKDALNCSKVIQSHDEAMRRNSQWLSWGSSWRTEFCDWGRVIAEESAGRFQKINKPIMDCLQAVQLSLQPDAPHNRNQSSEILTFLVKDPAPYPKGGYLLREKPLHVKTARRDRVRNASLSSVDSNNSAGMNASEEIKLTNSEIKDRAFHTDSNPWMNLPVHFPCHQRRPLVWHDHKAGELLLRYAPHHESRRASHYRKERLAHLCENMLLIDKVKDPEHMEGLWRSTRKTQNYGDFSPAFMYEDHTGWMRIISEFETREEEVGDGHADDGASVKRSLRTLGV